MALRPELHRTKMSENMKKSTFVCLLIGLGVQPVNAQDNLLADIDYVNQSADHKIRFLEKIESKDDAVVIPYEKYELANGLTVILHEDRSDPLVSVNVTYHVGSAHEEIGRSGFAHFFEHMMFQGSENVGDDEHFRIITEAGGNLNGTTSSDRTMYFQNVPSNQLEKVLWLEADRMGFLLPAVTEKKFEIQRETVKNERGQRVDNAAYGLVGELLGEAVYPEGHPYSWPVIGYIEDLNRADLDDLKNFFKQWYGPNNAVLSIGGDFDRRQTLQWVQQYFGAIQRGPEVKPLAKEPVGLDGDRYLSLEDKNAPAPMIVVALPTVFANHPDEPALNILSSILGEGETSLLYKNMVRNEEAVSAYTTHRCAEFACSMLMLAQPNIVKGKGLPDMERAMRESLAEIEQRGIQPDDLARVKNVIRARQIFGLERAWQKIMKLAEFQISTGSPNGIENEIGRYEAVDADDVMRVYNKYFKERPSVVLSVVPDAEKYELARADTWQRPERTIEAHSKSELPVPSLQNPASISSSKDAFDRSVQPSASDNIPVTRIPDVWKASLPNGIEVLGAKSTEVPITSIAFQIGAGQRDEPMNKLGLATLTGLMLNEATVGSTKEELANRIAKLGSRISVSTDDQYTTIRVKSLTENLDATLLIVAEMFFESAFNLDDFQRVLGQNRQNIKSLRSSAGATANLAMNRLLFGYDTAFAHRNSGTLDTMSEITVDDVKAFYSKYFTPGAMRITTVSDLPEDEIVNRLRAFSNRGRATAEHPPLPKFPDLKANAIYLIDKPGAAQSEIRIGKRLIPVDATGEYFRVVLANFPLAGNFSSRINMNLREDKGYTYGANGLIKGTDSYGTYVVQAAVRTDATVPAVQEFFKELSEYAKTGVTAEELSFTRQALGQGEALSYEGSSSMLRLLTYMQEHSLDVGFVTEQMRILDAIEKEEIDTIIDRHLNPEDMIMVIVGDKKMILEPLQELGREVIELDINGDQLTDTSVDNVQDVSAVSKGTE